MNEQEARTAAYRDALEKMGEDLGYDIVPQYFREFLNTDRIEAMGTYVSSFYTTFDNSGYYYYILAITPSERFDALRSEDAENARARDREIRSLLSSASAHYRENEDVDAISDVLHAVSLSLDGSLEYSPEALLSRAVGYVGNIVLNVDDSNGAICSVRMRRARGPFHPMVRGGKVDAVYEMVTNDGTIMQDSVTAATMDNGSFSFTWTNPYMVREGDIHFLVDIPDDVIAEIEAKAPEGFLDPLLSIREEKSVVYHYSLPDKFPHEEALIAIVPYVRGDDTVFAEESFSAFKSQMDSAGVGYDIVVATGEDDEDIIRRLIGTYPEKRYFIISYLGVTDYREAFDGFYVRVDGRNLVMDRNTLLVEEEIFASDGGRTIEEAERNALARGSRIAAGMLLKEI